VLAGLLRRLEPQRGASWSLGAAGNFAVNDLVFEFRLKKLFIRGIQVLVVALVMLVAVGLRWRALCQHQLSEAMVIRSANGIDERRSVRIGGVQQWITIRGQNRDNPAILVLHGGPGVAYSALSQVFLPWERDLTVIQWDQRGAGKSYVSKNSNNAPPRVETMVQDALDVSEYARRRLHRDKIILLCHSWGTVLGVNLAKTHPEFFDAYVGTGQVVNMQKNEVAAYARVLAKAHARKDRAGIAALEKSGRPPYRRLGQIGLQRQLAMKYEPGAGPLSLLFKILTAPDYSLKDVGNYVKGVIGGDDFLGQNLDGPFMRVDLPAMGTDFSIPVFMLQGAEDDIMPTALAKTYFDQITAPHKEFLLIPEAGHAALLTRSDFFLKVLLTQVRPLALER
jgi:pimeloyl-ACP methyl ester carboxylesterase